MSQINLLKKLKNGEITVEVFLKLSEDPSLDEYKMTKEEFLADTSIADSTKKHELMHAAVYEKAGIAVEFYFFGENFREAATSVLKESLVKWLEGKNSKDYLELLKRAVSAPGDEMGDTDKNLFEILNT